MEGSRRTASQKRLIPDQRVSGAAGNYIPGPTKRRRWERLFGYVVLSVGENRYLVRFDNGEEKELPSAVLKVESIVAALPPDALLPVACDMQEERLLLDAVAEQLIDDHEEEDLPDQLPDSGEAEAEEEMQNAAEENGTAEEEMENAADENGNDAHGQIPGQLPTEAAVDANNGPRDYVSLKRLALEKVAALRGTIVMVGTARGGGMSWKVIDSHLPPPEKTVDADFERAKMYGLKNFDIGQYKKSEMLVHIFLSIAFLEWKTKADKMNEEIMSKRIKVKRFSYEEFLIGLALLIGAAEFSQKGMQLFSFNHSSTASDDEDDGPGAEYWPSICQAHTLSSTCPLVISRTFNDCSLLSG